MHNTCRMTNGGCEENPWRVFIVWKCNYYNIRYYCRWGRRWISL